MRQKFIYLSLLAFISSSYASTALNIVEDILSKSLPKLNETSKVNNKKRGLFEGRIVSVSDGDTLILLTDQKEEIKIRLAEIDAPEKTQSFGQASKRSLSDMAYKKTARADCSTRDQYDRYVCHVSVDGLDVNKTQVMKGYAWVYRNYSKNPVLIKAEENARTIGAGLWVESNPTPPWEYRRSSKN